MGQLSVPVRVLASDERDDQQVDAIVDAGITHTLLPGNMLAQPEEGYRR